jgi:hypothetical protein
MHSLHYVAGGSPLVNEPPYTAPRAYEPETFEPQHGDERSEPDAEEVELFELARQAEERAFATAVQQVPFSTPFLVARVVGIDVTTGVENDNEPSDGRVNGRPVWTHYALPPVIGRPVPWVDAGGRRFPKLCKQQQQQRRWRTVHVDYLERHIEAPVTNALSEVDIKMPVDRAQEICIDRLRNRYVRITLGRVNGVAEEVQKHFDEPTLPRPLLGRGRGLGVAAGLGSRRVSFPRSRFRFNLPDSAHPASVAASDLGDTGDTGDTGAVVAEPVEAVARRLLVAPWMRLQRVMQMHREMNVAMGRMAEDVREELSVAQQLVDRAVSNEGLFNDANSDDEDDYGYTLTRTRGASAVHASPRALEI